MSGATSSNALAQSEKWNISSHISKQRMSQPTAVTATMDGELVNSEETQERKSTCHLAASRLQPLPMVSPEKIQDVKTHGSGPR